MLDSLLVSAYPVFLLALLLAWVVLAAKHVRPPRALWLALAVSATAFAARWALVPRAHQVFYDEYEHFDVARNLARSGSFAESLAGGSPDLDVLSVPTWPGLFHVSAALAMKVLGAREAAAFAVSAAYGAAAVGLVFLLALGLLRDEGAALLAAFLLAALPLHVKYSAAADLSACSLFWVAAVLLALEAEAGPWLVALTVACAAHARFENALLAAFAWPALNRDRRAAAALGLCLLPLIALVWRNRTGGLPGFGEGLGATLGHFLRHAPMNLAWLAATPTLAFVAAAAAWGARRTEWKRPLALSAAYLAVYSCFFRGAFANGSEDRYALAVILPLLPLAAAGVSDLARRFGRSEGLALAAAIFLALAWPAYGKGPDARFVALDVFLREAAPSVPADALVIAYNPPAVIAASGRAAASPYLFLRGELAPDRRTLVVLKDYWWHARAEDSARLSKLFARYREAPLARAVIDGREYGFFRLTPSS